MTEISEASLPELFRNWLALHQFDFFGGEAVELIDEGVDGLVGGFDLAGEELQFLGVVGGGAAGVQGQHLLYQGDHAAVQGGFGVVGKVDGADGELFNVLLTKSKISTPKR